MYHNFLSHSSVDGHLGCFHVIATINGAAMNNGIHVSLLILVSSEYLPSPETFLSRLPNYSLVNVSSELPRNIFK